MIVISLLLTFCLTFLITGFMLYVAMVTGIGPWVGPVVGIIAHNINKIVAPHDKKTALLVTISSSMAGIIAVAFGFSFPTWFFLDPSGFTAALTSYNNFLIVCSATVMVAGSIGIYASYVFYKDLLHAKQLPFPVGTMTYNAVMHDNAAEKKYLLKGILSYCLYALCFAKRVIGRYAFSSLCTFYKGVNMPWGMIPALTFDFSIIPLLVSIGFIAGSLMAFPLVCGALLKMSVVQWLYNYYAHLAYNDFLFAFCSGIVVAGTLGGLLQQVYKLFNSIKNVYNNSLQSTHVSSFYKLFTKRVVALVVVSGLYLYAYKFSFGASAYLLLGSVFCAYQMAYTAGKIGLALLGRFATYVMVPGMLLFSWSPLQVTLVATFVELVGGITVDMLHARKSLDLAQIDVKEYHWYQWVALCAAGIATAFFFYYFVTYYELGSSVLCAQRAQARALLLHVTTVDVYVLGWGVLAGLLLKQLKCNPVLVLSGLIMSFSLLIPLLVGGLLAAATSNVKKYEPFFSGMYIANACGSIIAMFL